MFTIKLFAFGPMCSVRIKYVPWKLLLCKDKKTLFFESFFNFLHVKYNRVNVTVPHDMVVAWTFKLICNAVTVSHMPTSSKLKRNNGNTWTKSVVAIIEYLLIFKEKNTVKKWNLIIEKSKVIIQYALVFSVYKVLPCINEHYHS